VSEPATADTAGTAVNWKNASLTIAGPVAQPPRSTRDIIRCEVGFANELILIPLTDLGASVLAQMMHGDHQFQSTWSGAHGPGIDATHGRQVRKLTIIQKTRPMLSSGADPYYTGMTLSPDEVKACRALVDARREKIGKAEYRKKLAEYRKKNRPARSRKTK
jgi:hypothetical protein